MKKLICILLLFLFILLVRYSYSEYSEYYENEIDIDPRIEIKNIKYFYGPNQWNYRPSLEIILDIKEFEKNHNLNFDEEVALNTGGGIVIEIKLLNKIGAAAYQDLMSFIAKKVVEFSKA